MNAAMIKKVYIGISIAILFFAICRFSTYSAARSGIYLVHTIGDINLHKQTCTI